MPSTANRITLGDLVRDLEALLEASMGAGARSEAQRLVMLASGCDRARLVTAPETWVDPDVIERARAFAWRRAAGEPYAYVAGRREFWGLDFEVGPGVLVPRPESETMIEAALDHLPLERPARVLDLGTGSGCLLLTVLHERPSASGVGVDWSSDALRYATSNRARHGLARRCLLVRSAWLDAVGGRFDLVLANPPYIPAAEVDALMVDVRDHEPRMALDGGSDGLDPHRHILDRLAHHLTVDGLALLELGHEQGKAAMRAAANAGFERAELLRDLGGRDRCLAVRPRPG